MKLLSLLVVLIQIGCAIPSYANDKAIQLKEEDSIDGLLGIADDFKVYLSTDPKDQTVLNLVEFQTRKNIATIKWDKDWGTPKYASISDNLIAIKTEGDSRSSTAIKLYNRKSNELVKNLRCPDIVYYPLLSSNGKYLVLVGNSLFIYDLAKKDALAHPPSELYGRGGGAPAVAFSKNSQSLAFATGGGSKSFVSVVSLKNLLDIWSSFGPNTQGSDKVKAGQLASLINLDGHKDGVHAIAFSPDGKKIAVTSDDTVKLYDSKSGRLSLTLKGHLETVLEVTFQPSGQLIATIGRDKTIRLWDANKGSQVAVIKDLNDKIVCRLLFSSDGQKLLCYKHPNASPIKAARIWTIDRDK